MKEGFDRIYQFKITLEGVRPPIWRRIQVPETYSFWDLHIAIQDAMGWENYHSYDFYAGDARIENDEKGLFVDNMWRNFHHERPVTRTLPASKTGLKEFIKEEGQKITYIYDLGDRWEHTVELEKILSREEGADYPMCIGGKRACPPEDCGGVAGYENLLEIIKDPNHPEHEERMEWVGGEFDPEHFDAGEVRFRALIRNDRMSPKRKVGRNDPCPCGSGKKYKKCCLNKDREREREEARKREEEIKREMELEEEIEPEEEEGERPQISRLAIMRYIQDLSEDEERMEELIEDFGLLSKESLLKPWTLNKVRKMSTPEIIEKLGSLDIEFDERVFRERARDHISAIDLADDFYYTRDYDTDDDDFIWLAIVELWNRFMPDRINVEMIDDTMQEGYKDLEKKDYKSGLEKWDRAWTMIKTIVPSHITSVEDADDFIPDLLTQSIINWCQDYEMEMRNAWLKDESYITKRMEYCKEFRRLFPDSDELIIQNMIRGEAESCAMLGDINAAEKLFEGFIAEYPDDPWGYIGWGDLYARPAYSKVPKDLDRAERIYRKGLEMCSYDRDVVLHRLKSLEDERRDLPTGQKHEKRKKRWEDFGARAAPITDKKMEMDLIYHIRTGRCPYNELECTPANCIYGNEGMNRCPIHQGEAIE